MINIKIQLLILITKKNDILDNISSLSSISEENAAMSDETNATVEEISSNMIIIDNQSKDVTEQSKSLLQSIKFFKI